MDKFGWFMSSQQVEDIKIGTSSTGLFENTRLISCSISILSFVGDSCGAGFTQTLTFVPSRPCCTHRLFDFGYDLCPVSYTHLTLPTRRTV